MPKFYRLRVALAFLALACVAAAKVEEGKVWEVMDLVFECENVPDQPFAVDLVGVFENERGGSMEVPGFYNGGKEWVVRFSPNEEGRWSARTRSHLPDLNGIQREFIVAAPREGTRGPLEVDPDRPNRIQYADGTPYHMLGFECDWFFALDHGERELTKSRILAETIAAHGFNQLIMNVYAFDVVWPKDPQLDGPYEYGGRLDLFPFGGSNDTPDYSTLNVAFFQHLDRLIELLDREGIIAHLMIYVWNKGVAWPTPESAADNLYFDYVVKRYQAYPNVLWDISKEALGYGRDDAGYITRRIDRLRAMDAYARLVTVHDYGYCAAHPEKVDIISVQTWKTDLYSKMMEMGRAFPDKPLLNIEHGGYEEGPYLVFSGDYSEPVACLRRNYHSAFAGVPSVYYWQNTSWNVIIHDMLAAGVEPKPKLNYYQYFAEFMHRVEMDTLVPSEAHSTSGFCLVNEARGKYIFYIPKENDSIIAQGLRPGSRLEIIMFDPLTGKYSEPKILSGRKNVRIHNRLEDRDAIAIVSVFD